ncbi:4170_t:CDS:2, partial [Gigaspora rosea]
IQQCKDLKETSTTNSANPLLSIHNSQNPVLQLSYEMEPILLNEDSGEGSSTAGANNVSVKTKISADVDRDRYEMVPMEEIE